MKFLVHLMLITLIFFHYSTAQKVNLKTVKRVAVNAFYNQTNNIDKNNIDISELIPITSKNQDTLFYIVNFKNKGFTIISAEKTIQPILGICKDTEYKNDDAPPGLLYLLSRYKTEITEIRKLKAAPSGKIAKKWKKYSVNTKDFQKIKSNNWVDYLLSTRWGQGTLTGNNSYNRYCPEYETNNHCYAGCVAVAMAQMLHYWNCWVGETGSHGYWWHLHWNNNFEIYLNADFGNANYQWSNMPTNYADNKNAKLIYHCGIACEMNYGKNGSSSLPSRAKDGLKNYFGFSNNIDVKWRSSHLRHWQEMLEEQLDNGWPLIYSGGNLSGGHTWVIDGYDDTGKFHCNWGSDGSYNGHYALGNFSPSSGNSFNQFESAIFNAFPTRTTRVGQPNLLPKEIYAGSNTITINNVEPSSNYQWTTTEGTISGNYTSAVLNTNVSTEVCVRAVNEQCNLYSDWDCETITVLPGFISGTNTVCNTNTTFILHNYPPNSNIVWSNSNNLTYISGQGTNNYTVKAANSGNGWIKVSINGISITKNIWVGTPSMPVTNPSGYPTIQMTYGQIMPIRITSCSGNPSQYLWNITGSINKISESGTTCTVSADNYGQGNFYVKAKNQCGYGSNEGGGINVTNDGGGGLLINPNPGNDLINVKIQDNKNQSSKNIIFVKLLNNYQQTVYSNTFHNTQFEINTSSLPEGIYILYVKYQNNNYSAQVIINHH